MYSVFPDDPALQCKKEQTHVTASCPLENTDSCNCLQILHAKESSIAAWQSHYSSQDRHAGRCDWQGETVTHRMSDDDS